MHISGYTCILISLLCFGKQSTAQPNVRTHPSIILYDSASNSPNMLNIREESPANTMVGILCIEDLNRYDNEKLTCTTDSNMASLNLLPIDGEPSLQFYEIATTRVIDREEYLTFDLRITCSDNGSPSLNSSMLVTVNVLDINDNSPTFPRVKYEFDIFEDIAPESVVSTVNAVDHDDGENGRIEYGFIPDVVSGMFGINPNSGEIKTKVGFDRELEDTYLLLVIARDKGVPRRTGTALVQVNIKDVNDNIPQFTRPNFDFNITGDIESVTTVAQLTAYDKDLNTAPLVYALVQVYGDNSSFPFAVLSDGTIVTTTNINLDEATVFSFRVSVSDSGDTLSLSSYTMVNIKYKPGGISE
ncbi:hypothetical protein FSP39_002221 [Pinctada imbricata]|uniref:Cadherin domain-containing protein n=1 Tax=Pinctada imbricata TaxID=66713 RepID=A0AA88XEU1_PINIB|nr:hypothetical protein FSP39_002221 [Pinctada imbricata]